MPINIDPRFQKIPLLKTPEEPFKKLEDFFKPKVEPKKIEKPSLLGTLWKGFTAPYEATSKFLGGLLTRKPAREAPSVFELVQEKAKKTPLGKVPGLPFVAGLAAELPLFGVGAKKRAAEKVVSAAPKKIPTKVMAEAKRIVKEEIKQKKFLKDLKSDIEKAFRRKTEEGERFLDRLGKDIEKAIGIKRIGKATTEQITKAHSIAKQKLLISEAGKMKPQYRRLAQGMTAKTSISEMTKQEADTFIDALQRVETRMKGGKLLPPEIPKTTKLVPQKFFERKFREPTLIRYITPSDRYAQTLGVYDLLEPSIKAKTTMELERRQVFNWVDQIENQFTKIKKVPLFERFKKGITPPKSYQQFYDDLDRFETAPSYYSKDEAEVFNTLRKFTQQMLKRTNEIRAKVDLEPIKGLKAYITHIFDTLTRMELKGKYPFPEEVKYWLPEITSKHVYNPTALQRLGRQEGLLKNPFKAIKAMASMDLKQIYLEQPNLIFREQLNALRKDIPATTRRWAMDYMNTVIRGRPTRLDEITNATFERLGFEKVASYLLRPLGKTVSLNPVKSLGYGIGRLVHDATIWGRIKLVVRNHTQKFLSLGLYDTKAFTKSFLPADKELKNLIKSSDFWKISKGWGLEEMPSSVVSKLERAGFAPYQHSHISNVTNTMKAAYHAARELVTNPKYKKLGWAMDDVVKEMEYGANTCQYWYNLMGMPEVYRSGLGKIAFKLQTWWMNYTTKYWREMLHRGFYGETGWGKPIPLKWRLGALRHIVGSLAFIEGTRRAFGLDYRQIALLGVLPSYLSPPGQITLGLYKLLTADTEWEKKKALNQVKYSWKAFIPSSGAWRDFSKVWSGEESLKYLFFHTEKGGEKEVIPIRRIKAGGEAGLPIRRIK